MNILIVDDSKLLRTVLKSMLAGMGFTKTYEATNGLEAIRKVHTMQPDLIFMNLIMPEMDGFEASKEILDNFSDTKIIIMSSNNYADTPFSTSNIKIHDYISIPFNKNRIKKALGCR